MNLFEKRRGLNQAPNTVLTEKNKALPPKRPLPFFSADDISRKKKGEKWEERLVLSR